MSAEVNRGRSVGTRCEAYAPRTLTTIRLQTLQTFSYYTAATDRDFNFSLPVISFTRIRLAIDHALLASSMGSGALPNVVLNPCAYLLVL